MKSKNNSNPNALRAERYSAGKALRTACPREAHARSGSSALLSGYMGRSDAFDRAIAAFSMVYADQNESDHAALAHAVRQGHVQAVVEEGR